MKTNVRLSHFGLLIPLFIVFASIFFTDCKGKAEIHDIIDSVINCEPPFVVYFFAEAEHRTKDLEYTWDFGDGGRSNELEPMHTYDAFGKYTVNLQVRQNKAVDNFSYVLDLTEEATAPLAEWDYTILAADYWAPCYMEFQNTSRHATSFLWDFDDGTTSTEVAPTHTFESAGTYNVVLNAICQQDTDKLTIPIEIKAPPSGIDILDMQLWMPESFNGSDIDIVVLFNALEETTESLSGVPSFPVTIGSVNYSLFYFSGNYNTDQLIFKIYSSYGDGSAEATFPIEFSDLSRDHYPDIISFDDLEGIALEVHLGYRD